MTTTFKNMQDEVARFISLTDSDTLTYIKRFLNQSALDVWWAHPWQERKASAYVNTVGTYSTGTITLTNGSAAVVGVGTVFTSAMEGRKVALSLSDPYYVILSVTDATHLTLDRTYVEDTAAATTFVLYQDILTLASMDSLLTRDMILMSDGYDYPMEDLTSQSYDNEGHMPRSASRPSCFRLIEDSGGYTRIQVWPSPDDAYAIRYRYMKPYTEMTADSDECVVPESRRDIVISGATERGYRYNQEYEKAEVERRRFNQILKQAILRERRLHPQSVVLRPFDHPAIRPGRTGRFYWRP